MKHLDYKTETCMIETIVGTMGEIEETSLGNTCFEDVYPVLTEEIWDAINSKNIAKLQYILGVLDELK